MKSMTEQFLAARKAGAPLILIKSPDHAITLRSIQAALKAALKANKPQDPIVLWDCVLGWTGFNQCAKDMLTKLVGDAEAIKAATTNAVESVELATKLPERCILFLANAQQGFDNPNFLQALWNLRDEFKLNFRQCVLLSPGTVTLPPEINNDCLILDEPLPTPDQLAKIVESCFEAAKASKDLTPELSTKAVDALCGLAAFPAEQATSMSLRKDEDGRVVIDIDDLWSRKRTIIESTPGLSVWRGGETFEDVKGYENAKRFNTMLMTGKRPPRGVLFLDELEKSLAGATNGSNDSSGVSQGFLGTILSYMQDNNAVGMIYIGPAGSGKSMVAKATGNSAGIPTISFDLSSMKASLVGESEARLRNALKVVTAVTQGQCLFIATCNKIAALPPELRRRFSLGTFWFGLPDAEERKQIWNSYIKKFALPAQDIPDDHQWTGAEIRNCCDIADRIGGTLIEASKFIVPVAVVGAKDLAVLEQEADGRFISASYPGFYHSKSVAARTGAERAISLDD